VLKKLNDAGKHTWLSQIKNVLITNGFGDVWIAQGVGNLDMLLTYSSSAYAASQNKLCQ